MTLQTILTPWQFWGTVAVVVLALVGAVWLSILQHIDYKRLINIALDWELAPVDRREEK